MNHIRLYDLFRRELHLPDDKASEFVVALDNISGITFDSRKDLLATKNDIRLLKDDMHLSEQSTKEHVQSVEQSIRKDLRDVDQSIRKDFYSLEQSIRKEIQQSKEDTYKAIFLAAFVQFIAILGSVLAIIKFIK
jgi:hypothetical protein